MTSLGPAVFPFLPETPGAQALLSKVAESKAQALINGTQTFLTYTTPNDGQSHLVIVSMLLNVTSAETGGAITVTMSNAAFQANVTASQSAGGVAASTGGNAISQVVPGNTTVTLAQTSALTAGAASVLAAQIWSS